jgi:hypothetical protein
MRPGVAVSGLESDGGDLFFCGGGSEKARDEAAEEIRAVISQLPHRKF